MSLREYAAWWRPRAAGQEDGALYVKDWHFAAEFPAAQVRPRAELYSIASAVADGHHLGHSCVLEGRIAAAGGMPSCRLAQSVCSIMPHSMSWFTV